jgi:glycosyltransferase involved in cell wall biosynthesis
VDARELAGKPTGVGKFLREVLTAWSAARPSHRFTLFLPSAPPAWIAGLGTSFAVEVSPARKAGTWWEQTALRRMAGRSRIDVLLAPGYTAPVRLATPSVVVVHDVSFFAHPEWFSRREGLRRRWITRAAAREARAVVTVSEFSAEEIVRFTGVPATRVHVIRHGYPAVAEASPLARRPLVLFVGSLFNRRRLPETIGAFARVLTRVPDARLVLVGDNRTSPRLDPLALASSLGVAGFVEWRAYASDAELDALYRDAAVFVFLSDYEGFAMTPLEALAHGAAPVLLDTPVAREIYASAARFVPPSIDAIADAMTSLLLDAGARAELVRGGQRALAPQTWAHTATALLDVLEKAAETA